MPDWQQLVQQRLAGLELDAAEKEEICAELAAHLQESYEELCRQGVSEHGAVQRTLSQVTNWRDLQRKIFVAKQKGDFMQKRLRQLWIPGFLTLILSMFSLLTAQTCGFQPPILLRGPKPILVYVPWLVTLPFIGALGAHFSSRAGGSRGTVLLASVFPAPALTAAFLLMFPIGMVMERVTGNDHGFGFVATALLRDGIGWLLIPGVALLAGGLFAHLLFSQRSSSQDTAIS